MSGASQSRHGRPLTAGVDVGTTSVKAVVADEDGNVVERARLPSQLVIGPHGRFEHDAVTTWWQAPRLALHRVLAECEAHAVSVSAMMPSVAAVDATGRPIGPGLLYGDARGSQEGSGDPTTSKEMAQLGAWAARHTPEAAGYWPAQAVANAALGGGGVTDLASAFAAGPLFNGSGWDPGVCEAAGLSPSQLPRVAVFGEAVGKVSPAALAQSPRGDRAGEEPQVAVPNKGRELVLGAGSVDGLCDQLVAGTVNDGDVLVGLGSTLVVWLTVPGWPPELPHLWRVPHLVAGKAMVGGASNAGGIWADWVDRVVRPARDTIAQQPNAMEGHWPDLPPRDVPIWWPWAKGERVPWHDRSLRIGLAGADLSHGPGALRRAAFEATGFVVRYILELASGCGTSPQRFVVSGGGTRNLPWLQAVADVLGAPVSPLVVPESAALGAAFLARMALGEESSMDDAVRWARCSAPVEPDPTWASAAFERYQLWRDGLPVRR
jgi:xylulokinase